MGDLMIDKSKPLNIELGVQKRTDPVYAVNKSGDFSKKSTREPEWPQNAEEKQPLSDINENKSKGVLRFEDVKKRVIQLGDIPRGIDHMAVSASGNESDNAMGVVPLQASGVQEHYEQRLASVKDALAQSMNPPEFFPLGKSRAKIIDKNDPGHVEEKAKRSQPIAIVDGIPSDEAPSGKKLINVSSFKNTELRTL